MPPSPAMRLLKLLGVDMGIQLAGFSVSSALQTEVGYDATGSATFLLLLLQSYRRSAGGLRRLVNTTLASLWATRLGSFLLYRVLKDGGDRRFDRVKKMPRVFLQYWLVQGMWVFVTSFPVLLGNCIRPSRSRTDGDNGSHEDDEAVTSVDVLGWATWAAGFALQLTADYQKSIWREDPRNAGKFIRSGVWALAQHPNYGGEILMWLGLWLSSSVPLSSIGKILTAASPAFTAFLLTRVSGVPLLRKAGKRRWGGDPAYQRYLATTPLLWPSILALLRGQGNLLSSSSSA